MRVIRTEMYFDPRDIEWDREEGIHANPGIAFAWFKEGESKDGSALGFQTEKNIQLLDDYQFISNFGPNPNPEIVTPFISHLVQDLRFGSEEFLNFPTSNRRIIQAVLESTIILENSPPEAVDFRRLLGKATSVSLGVYVGVQLAGAYPLLLIITIPTGIIVMGSAIGISKGLEAGLQKAIKRWFEGRSRKRKR